MDNIRMIAGLVIVLPAFAIAAIGLIIMPNKQRKAMLDSVALNYLGDDVDV